MIVWGFLRVDIKNNQFMGDVLGNGQTYEDFGRTHCFFGRTHWSAPTVIHTVPVQYGKSNTDVNYLYKYKNYKIHIYQYIYITTIDKK